jgi:hypothetical protein
MCVMIVTKRVIYIYLYIHYLLISIRNLSTELLRGSGIYHPNPTLGACICAGAGGKRAGGGFGTDWGGWRAY